LAPNSSKRSPSGLSRDFGRSDKSKNRGSLDRADPGPNADLEFSYPMLVEAFGEPDHAVERTALSRL